MRKTLREKEACSECGHVRFREDYVYTCDNLFCGREMSHEVAHKYSFTYSFDFEDHHEMQYCSLECFLKGMRKYIKLDSNYFSPNQMYKELTLEVIELLERLEYFKEESRK